MASSIENSISHGEVYEDTHFVSDEVLVTDSTTFGVFYKELAFADYWEYQFSSLSEENSTWDEI